jgi:hypothetical protein
MGIMPSATNPPLATHILKSSSITIDGRSYRGWVLLASNEPEIARFILSQEVAGMKPALLRRILYLSRPGPIADRNMGAADSQFPYLAGLGIKTLKQDERHAELDTGEHGEKPTAVYHRAKQRGDLIVIEIKVLK